MNRKKVLIPIVILTIIIIILVIVLNPNKRYKKLFVSEAKWDSIIQSRSSSKDLVLESIEFNDYGLIIDESSNTIYYSLVNDNKTKYNPNVSFSANEESVKLAILSDEITDEKVHSDYQFKIMIYNNSEYHIYNLVCTDFPILNITYTSSQSSKNKDKNIPIEIFLFNNLENTPNKIIKSMGKLDIINKNSEMEYKFKLFMNSPGKNKRENHISIFNMDPHNEYVLTTSEENQQRARSFKVELFVNGKYEGLYLLRSNESFGEPFGDTLQK